MQWAEMSLLQFGVVAGPGAPQVALDLPRAGHARWCRRLNHGYLLRRNGFRASCANFQTCPVIDTLAIGAQTIQKSAVRSATFCPLARCNDLESSNATLERLDRHVSLAMIVEFIVVQIGSYV